MRLGKQQRFQSMIEYKKFFEKKFHQKKCLGKASAGTQSAMEYRNFLERSLTTSLSNFDSPAVKSFTKNQSAMEYFMTYGWAILIIAVVLTVLFSMGITNPLFFAPKATAGSCQVMRTPVGPSLEGICNNEIPQYVAQFNGASSYIANTAPMLDLPVGYAPETLTAWAVVTGNGGAGESNFIADYGQYRDGGAGFGVYVGTGDCNPPYSVTLTSLACVGEPTIFDVIKPNVWFFVVGEKSQNGLFLYVIIDNAAHSAYGASSPTQGTFAGPFYIGFVNGIFPPSYWQGSIANVQLYNTSLSSRQVNSLFQEGIGGAPIDLQHLVGWWPLNGNANDYSGNMNDGTASNVIWSGTWWQSYTPS